MAVVFAVTYVAVLGAEIVGDKLLYTIGILAGRFSRLSIVAGTTAAFAVKMGAAVVGGRAITSAPPALLLTATSASFLWIAWRVWNHPTAESRDVRGPSSAVILSFSAVLLAEWCDLGQLTAATMAARFGAPFLVWMGAVSAMMTKAVLAMTIGERLRDWTRGWISDAVLRYASVVLLLTLGALSMVETLAR